MRIKLFGLIIIPLMISAASCAPRTNTTVVVNPHPKVIVVNKPRANNKVVIVKSNRYRALKRGRGGRVIIVR